MSNDWLPKSLHLERAEHLIYLATAVILVLAAAGLLVLTLVEVAIKVVDVEFIGAMLMLLDRALLVLMLAEIIYTVRRVSQRKRLEARPFFIVGIIAAIRRILVITAESASHVDIQDPLFQAAMVELGLLALIIVALAGAMRIIPDDAAASK